MNNLLCDPNTPNLDLSVHNTFFQSSSVQCLCSFAHLNLLFLLASLTYGFFFAILPRRPALRSHLFTVDIETDVLRTCEVSVSQTRLSNVLVLLLSFARGPPTPLSTLVRASLHCSVKGVGHSVVRDLQFLGNF